MFPADFEKVRDESNVEFREFSKLEREEVLPNIYVDSFLVDHGNCKPAYGFTIERDGKIVGLSGDSKLCSEVEQIVEKSGVAVLDASFIEKGEISHMGLVDMEELFEQYPNKKIIPTHMHDETKKMARKIDNPNFIVLNDGEEFKF